MERPATALNGWQARPGDIPNHDKRGRVFRIKRMRDMTRWVPNVLSSLPGWSAHAVTASAPASPRKVAARFSPHAAHAVASGFQLRSGPHNLRSIHARCWRYRSACRHRPECSASQARAFRGAAEAGRFSGSAKGRAGIMRCLYGAEPETRRRSASAYRVHRNQKDRQFRRAQPDQTKIARGDWYLRRQRRI